MRIVKTQKILYNRELRIRLISENDDADYIRRVRKLPDCNWSNGLNSWHTKNIENHISFLNKAFPASVRFYDITRFPKIPVIEEMNAEKRINIRHKPGEKSLVLNFLQDHKLTDFIKNLGAKQFEENQQIWTVSSDPEIYKNLHSFLAESNYQIIFENTPVVDHSSKQAKCICEDQIEKFRQQLEFRNYQKSTISQYVQNVQHYLSRAGKNHWKSIQALNDYTEEISINRNFSHSYQNQQINSAKAYYHFMHGWEYKTMKIKRPKKTTQNHSVLNPQEVRRILQLISNPKHFALFSILYKTGIKLSEIVSIRTQDINKDTRMFFIRGRNDNPGRNIPVSNELLEMIDNYRNHCQPENFLFEGYRGAQCSERSIQKALKKYVEMAGFKKKATSQTLRHSFAENQVSNGIDIGELQQILGYSNRKSTEIYCKMMKVENKKYQD